MKNLNGLNIRQKRFYIILAVLIIINIAIFLSVLIVVYRIITEFG